MPAMRNGLAFCIFALNISGIFAHGDIPKTPYVAFVSIPRGTFRMGDERGDLWNSCRPVHDVTISAFRMSETEITNAMYCVFLNSARERKEIIVSKLDVRGAKGKYRGKNYLLLSDMLFPGNRSYITFSAGNGFSALPGYERWPVVRVTWFGAKAFAEYYGWDIPREGEWEYACRSGRQQTYGTCDGTISANVANCLEAKRSHPVDVCSYVRNPWGLYDMTGNVWEWCDDWFSAYESGPRENPLGPSAGVWRVMRGGGWSDYDDRLCRSAARYYYSPNLRSIAVGFRVVQRQADFSKFPAK